MSKNYALDAAMLIWTVRADVGEAEAWNMMEAMSEVLGHERAGHIFNQLISMGPAVSAKVIFSDMGQDRIGLIKVVRKFANMGLKEAKDFVEAASHDNPQELAFPFKEAQQMVNEIRQHGGTARVARGG